MEGPRSVWTTRRGGARPVRQAPSTRGQPETRLRDARAAPLGPRVPTCAPRRALQGQVLPLARGREAVSSHAGTGQTWSAWPPASVAGSPRLPSLAAAVGRCQWHVIEGHRSRKVPEDRAEQASPPPAGPQTQVPQGPLCHGFWSERACQDMDEAGGFSRQRGRGRGSAALGPVARSPRPRGQKVPALRRSGRRPAPHGHAHPACLVPTWFAHTARGASSRDAHTSKAHTDRTEIRPCSGNYTDPDLPLVCFAIFTRDSLFSY